MRPRPVVIAVALLLAVAGGAPGQEREAEVRRRLHNTNFSFEGRDVPLLDVIQVFREAGEVDIVVDRATAVALSESRIDLRFRELRLENALSLVLTMEGLTWEVRHGVVFVSAREAPLRRSESFEIGDLAVALVADSFDGPAEAPGNACDALAGAVAALGAQVTTLTPDRLVCLGTQVELDAVRRLLEDLRRVALRAYDVEIVRGRGALEGETDPPGDRLLRGRVLGGRTLRDEGLAVQVLPVSTADRARLRLASSAGALAFRTEVVVAAGAWTRVASHGPEWIAARVVPVIREEPPTEEAEILAVLDRLPIDRVDFENQPLEDVVGFLRDHAALNIMIDPDLFRRPAEERRLCLRVRGISLRDLLDLVASILGLEWSIQHGVIVVHAPRTDPTLEVHDLRPASGLLDATDSTGESAVDLAGLETFRVGPYLVAKGPPADQSRLAARLERTPAGTPAMLRLAIRDGASEVVVLVPGAHGVRLRMPGDDDDSILRASRLEAGGYVVEVRSSARSATVVADPETWTPLPGDRAVRVEGP